MQRKEWPLKKVDDKFADLAKELPIILGNEAKNFFVDAIIKDGGFTDTTLIPYKPRKRGSRRNAGRRILIDSGRLYRSIQVKRRSMRSVTIGTDVPYASYHNEGIEGRLPKRQFIGNSKTLESKLEKEIVKELDKAFPKGNFYIKAK